MTPIALIMSLEAVRLEANSAMPNAPVIDDRRRESVTMGKMRNFTARTLRREEVADAPRDGGVDRGARRASRRLDARRLPRRRRGGPLADRAERGRGAGRDEQESEGDEQRAHGSPPATASAAT